MRRLIPWIAISIGLNLIACREQKRPQGYTGAWWEYVDHDSDPTKYFERDGWLAGYANCVRQCGKQKWHTGSILDIADVVTEFYVNHPQERNLSVTEALDRFLANPVFPDRSIPGHVVEGFHVVGFSTSGGLDWRRNAPPAREAFIQGCLEYFRTQTGPKLNFPKPASWYVAQISDYYQLTNMLSMNEMRAKENIVDVLVRFRDGAAPVKREKVPNAVQRKDAEEQLALGEASTFGDNAIEDPVEGVKWFRMAAGNGNALAQYYLGAAFAVGRGVTQDLVEAVKWFRKSAEQGKASGQYGLGRAYEKGEGVPQDLAEGMKWYRKAAAQGHAMAQFSIGHAYYTGKGVRQDETEAVKWYRKAAEQGNPGAQYSLGVAYFSGEGIAKDEEKAYFWTLLGAKGSSLISAETRDKAAQQLAPAARARIEEEASRWTPKVGN